MYHILPKSVIYTFIYMYIAYHISIACFFTLSLFQFLQNFIIILWFMRKCTLCARLYLLPPYLHILWITKTLLHSIHRAITKQTVKILHPLMTRKILTFSIFKKTIGILHTDYLFSVFFLYATTSSTKCLANVGLDG